MIHLDPTKRHDFVILFDVENAEEEIAAKREAKDPNAAKHESKARGFHAELGGEKFDVQAATALRTAVAIRLCRLKTLSRPSSSNISMDTRSPRSRFIGGVYGK